MEKEEIVDALNRSMEMLNSGAEVYICDTFLQQIRNGNLNKEQQDELLMIIGSPINVPLELRGVYWVGTEWNFWEKHQSEPRIKYLQYLIEQL